MKKYVTIVPFLRFCTVMVVITITTYVGIRIFLYENPYKNISNLEIKDNRIIIKNFSIKIYPTDDHEILIKSKEYYTDIKNLNKHTFVNVHTHFK